MKVKINGEEVFRITSKFGDRESFRQATGQSFHTGIDLQMNVGTDIMSPVHGYVARIFDYGNMNAGRGIAVHMDNGKELIFGHMSKINPHLKVGDAVNVADRLGWSGNTGFSTAPH